MLTKTLSSRWPIGLLAGLLFLGAVAVPVHAVSYQWDNTAGGDFSTPTNWMPVGSPVAGDTIEFDHEATYTVQFSATESCSIMRLYYDQVTFQFDGHGLDLSGVANIGLLDGDYGYLTVVNGSINSMQLNLGYANTASGGLTLRGRSEWNVSGTAVVGYQDEAIGSLTVEDGRLTCNRLRAGYYGDSVGAVSVTGREASLDVATELNVGYYAQGRMSIAGGAYVESYAGVVGYGQSVGHSPDPYGEVSLSGRGTLWYMADDLTLGQYSGGDGCLSISDGAKVDNAYGILGNYAGAGGRVTIDGSRSQWECRSLLIVGSSGLGEVSVGGGALLETQDTLVAETSGSNGSMVIDGSGTVWNNQLQLTISTGGTADVLVRNGAVLNNGSYLEINPSGVLTIDGGTVSTGSLTMNGGQLNHDAGTLTINGGWYNQGSYHLNVDSRLNGDVSTLRLASANATVSGVLSVGVQNTGAVEVGGGSAVSAADVVLGTEFDSMGTLSISGVTSNVTCGGTTIVGNHGGGELNVSGGGRLETNLLSIAKEIDGNGTVAVDSGGTVNVSQNLFVGGSNTSAGGSGTLTAGVGGTVEVDGILRVWSPGVVNLAGGTISAGDIDIAGGTLNFTSGTLNITDNTLTIGATGQLGSTLSLASGRSVNTPSDMTYIQADGKLDLAAGGSLSSVQIISEGEIVLGGPDAVVAISSLLENYGLIRGSGRIDGQLRNNTAGQIRIESGQRLLLTGAGSSNDGQIDLVDGTFECSELFINDVNGFISGRGQIRTEAGLVNDGTIALSGGFTDIRGDVENNTTPSLIVISGGATATFYDDVHSDGEIRVSAASAAVFFGAFTGTGGTTGTGTVYIEGDLRPGNSPAEVSFGGDLMLGGGASLEIELGGTVGGTTHDIIDVAGQLSLGGTLDVVLIDSFSPSSGDTFDILNFASLAGVFGQVNLPGLDSYLDWDTSDICTTGELSVVFYGDANHDDTVDDVDATILAANWGRGPNATWENGDFNRDGHVDSQDVALMAANWLVSLPPASASVPEPSSVVLLGIMLSIASAAGYIRKRH